MEDGAGHFDPDELRIRPDAAVEENAELHEEVRRLRADSTSWRTSLMLRARRVRDHLHDVPVHIRQDVHRESFPPVRHHDRPQHPHFGLETYASLLLRLAQVRTGTALLDCRRFHLLSEHEAMVLRRIAHLATSCALDQPQSGPLDSYRELDRRVREFRLRLLFLPPEQTASEAARGGDFLNRVRETETRLLEQVVRVTEWM